MVNVFRISCPEALESIAGEWSALIEQDPKATPFHRPEWLIPWWRRLGSGELHALLFRGWNGRPVGFVPLFIHQWMGRRQVTLAGTGVTDYPGLTALPDAAAECARLTFEYLRANRERWDVCDWPDLREDSPLIAAVPPAFQSDTSEGLPCTRVRLPSDPDDYQSGLPHGLRRTLRQAEQRLEREGELRFETLRGDPGRPVLDELFRLHETRWADRGGPESMLDRPAVQRFLLEASRRMSATGRLRLYTVRFRGELAAVILGFIDRGRVWGYITGMDPELGRFSPGSLVLSHAIRDAIGEGASAWEFLRGDEAYKFQWGAQKMPKLRLRLS